VEVITYCLKNGEFDILEAISYTDERSQTMDFSRLSMDDEKYYIFAQMKDADISISDISSLDGKRVGVLINHLPEEELNEWENDNNIHTTHINISTKEEVLDKIENKEIDCFVSVEANYWGGYGIAPITCIGGSDVYFAVQKGNGELKEELDNAMRRIADEYPFFTADLHKRYFTETSIPVLTKEEQMWLAEHASIRIGYLKNDGGVSTLKSDTGELIGVINDYVRLAEKSLYGQNLHFELKVYNSRLDLLDALHNKEIDLVFNVTQNPYYAEMYGYDLSETTWTTNMAAVSKANTFDEEADNTVAVLSERNAIEAYILWNYPKWKIVKYDSMDEIEKATKRGDVDCFVV